MDEIEQSKQNILDILDAQDNWCLIQDEEELPTELQFLIVQAQIHPDCGIDWEKLYSIVSQLDDVKRRFGKVDIKLIDNTMNRLRKELTNLITKEKIEQSSLD